jgi:hypothetical protein
MLAPLSVQITYARIREQCRHGMMLPPLRGMVASSQVGVVVM